MLEDLDYLLHCSLPERGLLNIYGFLSHAMYSCWDAGLRLAVLLQKKRSPFKVAMKLIQEAYRLGVMDTDALKFYCMCAHKHPPDTSYVSEMRKLLN